MRWGWAWARLIPAWAAKGNRVDVTVGVDVGGTFTDLVTFDGRSVSGRKVATTSPEDRGVTTVLLNQSSDASTFLHGTTVATNQLLQGNGARVALVTTSGFEDVVEIGRQARPSLYDSFDDRPLPLVPRERRIGYSGDIDAVIEDVRASEPDVVAVALVRSYADPADERTIADAVRSRLSVPVSVGADISPPFREFERVATTVLNAYLTPTVSGYLQALDDALAMESKLVMTSAGGLIPFGAGAAAAGRLVLSGPAAGVVAAAELGRSKGSDSVISFDMGGTSTDVSRVGSVASGIAAHKIGGRINRVPSMPVRTIGAGGGSIAWADAGGALRVGPRSAGADPGPAAYGIGGTEATVTDANLVLGSIPRDLLLGGQVKLDVEAAHAAIGRLGVILGLTAEATAAGIIEVVDNHMERALRAVSVEEGADPRGSALVAFGGAGGLHGSRLARSLGMQRILIPPLSGVFSALGLLLARPSVDFSRTVLLAEGSDQLTNAAAELLETARRRFSMEHRGAHDEGVVVAEARYLGQSHELAVPLTGGWPELRSAFEQAHLARFGFDRPTESIDLINLRVEVSGPPPLTWDAMPALPDRGDPIPGKGIMAVDGTSREADVWQRDHLPSGFNCDGPALVVERDSAVRLEDGDRLTVHDDGTLEITI